MILVDSNVLIDIFNEDEIWMHWSRSSLEAAVVSDQVMVNHIVVAEVAPQLGSLAAFQSRLNAFEIEVIDLTLEAAFVSGQAFVDYRRQRRVVDGQAKSIIADFLIGGQAATLGATILTRDPRFYRNYFPTVPLIAPEKDEND